MAPPRSACYSCSQPVIVGAKTCPYCQAPLVWSDGSQPSWLRRTEIAADAALVEATRRDLAGVSHEWTLPAVQRHYESGAGGDEVFAREVVLFDQHGYQPSMQSAEGSHLHAGRILMTGGLSMLAGRGGIRSKGKLTVMFQKQDARHAEVDPAAPEADSMSQLAKLGQLRDAGVVTEEEFAAKKAELLARL